MKECGRGRSWAARDRAALPRLSSVFFFLFAGLRATGAKAKGVEREHTVPPFAPECLWERRISPQMNLTELSKDNWSGHRRIHDSVFYFSKALKNQKKPWMTHLVQTYGEKKKKLDSIKTPFVPFFLRSHSSSFDFVENIQTDMEQLQDLIFFQYLLILFSDLKINSDSHHY